MESSYSIDIMFIAITKGSVAVSLKVEGNINAHEQIDYGQDNLRHAHCNCKLSKNNYTGICLKGQASMHNHNVPFSPVSNHSFIIVHVRNGMHIVWCNH